MPRRRESHAYAIPREQQRMVDTERLNYLENHPERLQEVTRKALAAQTTTLRQILDAMILRDWRTIVAEGQARLDDIQHGWAQPREYGDKPASGGLHIMTYDEAVSILRKRIKENGSLYDPSQYTTWDIGEEAVFLDGHFTMDELEAMAVYCRKKNADALLTESPPMPEYDLTPYLEANTHFVESKAQRTVPREWPGPPARWDKL